ncbi:exonuclease domain-containing protein [Shewanella sp. JNE10-2]|uniref:exonuclease domain-containing protein n=1 Tax=unclassified Shewanella TaxID=196818 RepID=UPI002002AE3B|nr:MULTISPECIES: exonuclease domain-containing protein [unclassified Shewanella]MCK7629643.1 exonuclease domain-containing protein [Shewanella sp. JNE9-1]MCK7644909.1 exonuclease domain-containing protein [Shewanella sp. JNE3-1]MCK7652946.1 exonuclease domain-containing protein [Shewanella sp. JNE4-1]UPO29237.1 exonuclease domain-containing protein [Shewanella sp. JNE10-2]UPO37388.1 exonuclease domain-containing protein [Shewanella sp. JNE7]
MKMRLNWRALRCQHQLFKDYYQSLVPLLSMPVSEAPLMAMDLEMTGLDPLQDQILSIGLVPIEHGVIPLEGAQQKLVQIRGSVGQSATIHGILDNHLVQAVTIEDAMAWFIAKTRGRVLVAHHSPLDCRFLQQDILAIYHQAVFLPSIDTLMLEKRRLLRGHHAIKEGSLRLGACRERYGLPVYSAHSALTDALACAELLLAQVAAMDGARQLKVTELMQQSS